MACNVANCLYVAESAFVDGEDTFPVCIVHDHANVEKILHRGERPAAFWMHDRPIVVSLGPLEPEHLVLKLASSGAIDPRTCDLLAAVSGDADHTIHADFDLTT
jgi:hypothetical protein